MVCSETGYTAPEGSQSLLYGPQRSIAPSKPTTNTNQLDLSDSSISSCAAIEQIDFLLLKADCSSAYTYSAFAQPNIPMPRSSPHQVHDLCVRASPGGTYGLPEKLDKILESGADPNVRPKAAIELLSTIPPGWASLDPPPQFNHLRAGSQSPLHYAASVHWLGEDVEQMVTALLRHGADPFLEFPQLLHHPRRCEHPRSPFPGEDTPRSPSKKLPSDFEFTSMEDIPEEYGVNSEPDFSDGDEPPPQFGVRHSLHAILEDGGRFKPFMDYPGFLESLDVEHRDPQGRTLLLSACRNSLGADARADVGFDDYTWDVHGGGWSCEPFPKWDQVSGPTDSDFSNAGTESIVDVLLRLGADPLAVDAQGKSVLHHLLVEECNKSYSGCLPVMRRTLRIMATKYPSLVNQPDQHGTYPLHAALRRMRLNWNSRTSHRRAEPLGCVLELLRAGADPRAKDVRGNTALHYLADDDLTAIWFGQEQRQLVYDLLDKHGCAEDINRPNHAGKTVAEMILDDNGRLAEMKDSWYGLLRHEKEGVDLRDERDVDEELFGTLDGAGMDWGVRTSDGSTLLHLVAHSGLGTDRLIWRCKFLLGKGVDIKARDNEGWTAWDVAGETGDHRRLARTLKELEGGDV